jgi:hypothetical protein
MDRAREMQAEARQLSKRMNDMEMQLKSAPPPKPKPAPATKSSTPPDKD